MAESELMEVLVFLDSNETLPIRVNAEEAAQASNDAAFLLKLVQREQARTGNGTRIVSETIQEEESQDTAELHGEPHAEESELSPQHNEKEALFIWPPEAVFLYLERYRERQHEFNSGTKRHNKLWSSIAEEMKKTNLKYTLTGPQCSSKMSTLRRTYKSIKDQNNTKKKTGNHPSSWAFFSVMDELFGEKAWATPKCTVSSEGPTSPQPYPRAHSVSPSGHEVFGADSEATTSGSSPFQGKNIHKRRVETVLEGYIKDIKTRREEDRAEMEKRKEEIERRRQDRYRERREERVQMHQERMSVQRSLIDVLAKLVNN